MDNPANEDTLPEHAIDIPRRPWVKPMQTVLPIEDTATGANTGNDGSGPTTAS